MKWVKRLAVVLLAVVATTAFFMVSTARRSDNPVGFQVVRVESSSGPVAVALWYPTTATPRPTTFMAGQLLSVARDAPVHGTGLPMVMISHGNSGSALSHVDLAMALASAGYIVAAPTHGGDNFVDQRLQTSPSLFNKRAQELRLTLDYVVAEWTNANHVDLNRIGAFGFSAGGFTVLTLAGAVPDMARISAHCQRTPEFICAALEQVQSPLLHGTEGVGQFEVDRRIRAAVVAAPGLGFTFAGAGLADVRIPVQVWSGDRDETVPYATNTRIVQEGLGAYAEPRQLSGAAHLSFLAPCGVLRPPGLCSDPEGFDRPSAHAVMNAEVIRFFNAQLQNEPSPTAAP